MERLNEIEALLADEAQVALLSPEDVAALRAELEALYTEVRAGDEDGRINSEGVESLGKIAASLDTITEIETKQKEAEDALAAQLADLDAKVLGESEVEETPEPEADDETPAPESEVEDAEPELVTAAAPKPVSLSRLNASIPARTKPRPQANNGERLRAVVDGTVQIDQAGSEIGSLSDISQAIIDTGRSFIGDGPRRKVKVASVETDHYINERTLDSKMSNSRMTELIEKARAPEAITAAGGVCGPATPRYDQMVISTSARPIRDALLRFGADRGAITYVPPIDISDIGVSGGGTVQAIDVITNDEDIANTTKPNQIIVCGAPVTCTVDAITNILTFGNLLQRTGSEQMDAYVQYAEAAHARVAEQTLLASITSGSTAVSAGAGTVEMGALREFFHKVLHLAANQRYAYRMAPMSPIRVLVPAWFGEAMIQDYILASHTEGVVAPSLSLDTVAGWFRSHGINLTWTLDQATGIPAQPVGELVAYPGTAPGQVTYHVFPEGSWLFLDGGQLDLGVVRDSTLNALNRFQLFSETFEHACLVGPWSLVVTQGFCVSGASGGEVDPEDYCTSGS